MMGLVIVDVHVLEGLAHAGDHPRQVLDVAHLLDLLDLLVEVPEGVLVPGHLLAELAGLLLVELLLRLLHEGNDIAHAQDPVRDAGGMEHVQRLHLLAGGDELDGLADDSLDGQGRAAAGVAVHLGEDDAVEVQAVVEGLRRLHGVLAGHRVHDEQRLRGLDGLVQGGNLVHQLLVHGQAAGGIDDDHAVALGLRLPDGVLRDLDRILLTVLGVHRHADALAEHFQLLDGGRAERVAGREEHLHAALGLDVQGQLAGERGLTGTVQTRDQHDAGIPLHIDVLRLRAHELRELVVHDLDHHLLRLHRRQHVRADGLVLHAVAEVLRHLVAHVRVQQGLADVLYGLRHIDLGDLPFTLQYLERPLQSLAQILKHSLFGFILQR